MKIADLTDAQYVGLVDRAMTSDGYEYTVVVMIDGVYELYGPLPPPRPPLLTINTTGTTTIDGWWADPRSIP